MLSGSEVVENWLFIDESVDEPGVFPARAYKTRGSEASTQEPKVKVDGVWVGPPDLSGGRSTDSNHFFLSVFGRLRGVFRVVGKIEITFIRRKLGTRCGYHSTAFFQLYRMI